MRYPYGWTLAVVVWIAMLVLTVDIALTATIEIRHRMHRLEVRVDALEQRP